MHTYDYFIAGRWRNHEKVREVLDVVRAQGKTAYCFIENQYAGEKVEFDPSGDIEQAMGSMESLAPTDPFVRKVFDADITGEQEAINFVLILPAGISGHIEAGIAYGMGKPCYAVGVPDKTETLYCIFDRIFPDAEAFAAWLATQNSTN